MLVGPVEPQHRTPVVQHENDVLLDSELFPQSEQIIAVLAIAVAIRSGRFELVRVAHTDEIARDEASQALEMGHDVAPEIRGCRVAVLKDDGSTGALLDIAHPASADDGGFLFVDTWHL